MLQARAKSQTIWGWSASAAAQWSPAYPRIQRGCARCRDGRAPRAAWAARL